MAKKRKVRVPCKSLRRSSPPSESDDDESEGREASEEASSSSSPSRKELRELLEPMEKEQLIETIVKAAALSPSLLARITSADEDDPSLRNIYVHGLPWDATSNNLTAAFSSFGAIEHCNAAIERATGRCKGYGFVLFYTCDAAQRALCQPQKKIAGHTTSCQLAATRPQRRYVSQDFTTADPGADRTILIGNVGEHISADQLRAFFSQFGRRGSSFGETPSSLTRQPKDAGRRWRNQRRCSRGASCTANRGMLSVDGQTKRCTAS